jgi:hypothetical protein
MKQTTTTSHISIAATVKRNMKDCAVLFGVFVFGLYLTSPENPAATTAAGHRCTFNDCKLAGATQFYSDCEEGSDCYYFDLTHWQHPTWTPDQCEEYIFNWQGHEQDATMKYYQ